MKVTIEDLQVGDAESNTQEEIERIVKIIWNWKHLLIGKGNALPPAAKGVVCGNAKPVAQRYRKVTTQFREKLYQLIKGLLSARMIRHSTSPWASHKVVIIKKNGIDSRLCIDYRLWLLGSAYDGPRPSELGVRHAVRNVRVESNAVQIKRSPDLLVIAGYTLYGFLKVTSDHDRPGRRDVFETGEPI
ncbi:reverse transcriptase [Phytophthora palmivora]|uniref:Reverse transcriptase n=1 Tax=Phytophthora palmivora TaxID=4796 RepID=A0A2P4X9N3_9STRA|nr:reverse transcriptase [Phytophthora palmivora]